MDRVIEIVGAAQQPDGYLDNFYTAADNGPRWSELVRTHELYCLGHLIQAAIAHQRATGGDSLMNITRRFADLVCDVIGPAEQGKKPGTEGHPIIEMALTELYRQSGDAKYLEQANYLLDARGHGYVGGDEYHQDHVPFRQMEKAVGHAVRFVYLTAGAADIYAETGDESLRSILEKQWHNAVFRRMYLTGGLGSRHGGESLGVDYELPNSRAYTETCAAIAAMMWNWRMLVLDGEAKYADMLEW